jgi:hypothetical protein
MQPDVPHELVELIGVLTPVRRFCMILVLAAMFRVEGPLDLDPFTEWPDERLHSAIEATNDLHLIRKVNRGLLRKRPEGVESTDAGQIVLAAEMRRRGKEIIEGAAPRGEAAQEWKSEVLSTDWSFGAGQNERCFGDGADPLRAQSDAVERLPAGLEQRDAAFALGA